MPSKNRKPVQLPLDVYALLAAERARMQRAIEAGYITDGRADHDQGYSFGMTIKRLLEFRDAHRRRSRRSRRTRTPAKAEEAPGNVTDRPEDRNG